MVKVDVFRSFMMFFLAPRFLVGTSRAVSLVRYVVVGPLVRDQERERESVCVCVCVSQMKTFLHSSLGASGNETSGRTAPLTERAFDNTMGFPGEDVD